METKKFDKWFEISSDGTVRSLDRCINGRWFFGKTLSPRLNNGRGLQVHCNLSTGKSRFLYVAKLVYCAFCTKGDDDILSLYDSMEGQVVIHKDGNLCNNAFDNLALEDKGVILNEAVARNKKRIKVVKE